MKGESKSDKVNAIQEDIGTAGIELIFLLCGKFAKIKDANFHGYQFLRNLLTL